MEIKTRFESEINVENTPSAEQSAPCVQELKSEVMETTEPSYADYINWVANHAAVVNPIKSPDDEQLNEERGHLIKQMIKDMAPNDPIEAMLISQMACAHNATILAFMRGGVEIGKTVMGKYPAAHLAVKFANVFTRQIEALALYRGKESTQKITVEQVKVEAGGQAVVGNIHGGTKTR